MRWTDEKVGEVFGDGSEMMGLTEVAFLIHEGFLEIRHERKRC